MVHTARLATYYSYLKKKKKIIYEEPQWKVKHNYFEVQILNFSLSVYFKTSFFITFFHFFKVQVYFSTLLVKMLNKVINCSQTDTKIAFSFTNLLKVI